MKLLIYAAPFVAVSWVHAQTTWYVDAHASGPGTGTVSDPYNDINYAVHAATTSDHDTVLVRPGVYVGQVKLDRPVVVLSTDGPLATQIRGAFTVADLGGFNLANSDVRLEGFTVQRTGTGTGRVVRMIRGELDRCIVIGNGAANGVYFEDQGSLEHCVVTGCVQGLTELGFAYGGNVLDSVVWGNQNDAQIGLGGISYSVVGTVSHDEVLGLGVLRVNPGFFDLARHDVHLQANSVCIDAGNPAAPTDPDGSRNDIGAVVFDASYAPFEIYCTAKTNSLGCVPAIGATGNASFSSTLPFTITCANELNQKLGLIFHGYAQKNTLYQGGYLCVQSPVRRSALMNSGGALVGDDCSGIFNYDFNALIASQADSALQPGTEVFAQFWSRDPNASFTTNRSDAIRFHVQP